jgi:polysaccharide pyruvyl transferase WcaK-like protein
LQGADALLIGGGKLLMDNQLDFPFKLNRLFQLARQQVLPIHLTAVGVGKRWSRTGKRLVEPLVHQAATISVRDARSLQLLQAHFGNIKAIVTCDPAIWAGEVYHPDMEQNKNAPIGINVINPLDANTHLSRALRWSAEELLDFYLQLTRQLAGRNLGVEIFTNGNRRDDAFASRLFQQIQHSASGSCSLAKRPTSPSELVKWINGYQGVIASRLHAAVLSAALDKPCLGLAWDEKIAAFYSQVGQTRSAVPIQNLKAVEVADRLIQRLQIEGNKEALQLCQQKALLNATQVLKAG